MEIVRMESFEQEFETEEFEMLVLVKNESNGATVYEKEYLRPSVDIYASVDCRTMELSKKAGILCWLIKKEDHNNYGFAFKKHGIYRVLVKKIKPVELKAGMLKTWNDRYLVLEVLEKAENAELKALAEYYERPLTIKNELGEFTLDRDFDIYNAKIDLDGKKISVMAELDEDSEETADKAFNTLSKYSSDMEAFDMSMRKFASEIMLDDANDWLESDESEDKPEEITEQIFVEKMTINEVVLCSDGSVTAYYDDGDLFWGHSIVVEIDENGEFVDAYIAG